MKDENEVLHTTKEVINLDELTESAINSIEQIVDENMVEADLQFQEEIEQLHVPEDTMILEPDTKDKKTKKENIFKKLKDKWQKLSKKKKIIIIVVSIIVLILIGVGLFFLLSRKPESLAPEVPDVIVLEDNYRYENGVLHFLDDEEEIGTYECNNKDENKCFVAYLTNDDEFDGLKQINDNDDEINVRSKIYNNRFVFVFDNKSENDEIVKLYDIKENEVKEEFLQVKAYDFIEDAVILKNMDSKYGLVTFTSEEVKETIPYQYDKLGILSDDKNLERLVAKKDGSFYLINQNNEVLTNAMAEMIVGANKKHLKTKNANVYTVFDYQGKEVGKGDYALLLDDYVIFARDMQLFVTDYEKHPMNLDGIAIKNNTYNPIATYKNNKLVKTEKSFDAQVYDKNLILTIYDDSIDDLETVTLNLLDGLYSANLAFMNYLNGKLYFYSDEKKENLLGSYVCSNKNSIDSVNATLKNCTIASESFLAQVNGNEKEENKANDLGLLPVFYNRYIFIRDGNDAIVLYDLKESSTKAWYTKVDAKIYNKADKLSTVDKGPYYYIAESERSGNYGLAKITANSVEVQLEFKYNSLYRLGDYYVVQTDSDYFLADVGGRIITNAKPGSIVDYNGSHLKYVKDNKYYVSEFDKDSDGNSYEYIELYDKYYAAVSYNKDDKKNYLSIFAYGAEEPVNNKAENILLVTDKYYGVPVKAFNLTFDKNTVKVEIAKNEKEYNSPIVIDLNEKYEKPKEDKPVDEDNSQTVENQGNGE